MLSIIGYSVWHKWVFETVGPSAYCWIFVSCVRLSVTHKSEFCRNGWTNRAGCWHASFLPPILRCVKKEIRASPKITPVLSSGTLSQTPDCGQLVLREISKFDAASCQTLRLKCAEFSAWGEGGKCYSSLQGGRRRLARGGWRATRAAISNTSWTPSRVLAEHSA